MYYRVQLLIGCVLHANDLLSAFRGGVYEGDAIDIGRIHGESRTGEEGGSDSGSL